MKSMILASCMLLAFICVYAHDPGEIDEKLLLQFKKTFPTAERVTWSQSGENFIISFLDQGLNTRITYSKDGDLIESIRYYHEKNLPLQIRVATKQQYAGKKIFGVSEVSTFTNSIHPGLLYYIRLEDEKGWLTVVADNEGNSRITESFEK